RQFLASSAGLALGTALAGPALAADENAALRALLDRFFEQSLDESPERTSVLGFDKGARAAAKAKLDDYSLADKTARLARTKAKLAAIRKIDRAHLTGLSVVDYDVVESGFARSASNGTKWTFGEVDGNFAPYL